MTSGEVLVRVADEQDDGAIADTHIRAFGRPDEAALVRRIIKEGGELASLVAEAGGIVVGHALLSRVDARVDGRPVSTLALNPVSVRPTHQHRGIGSRLVRAALAHADEMGAEVVVVVGDPGFYRRFGFSTGPAQVFGSIRAPSTLQAVELVPGALSGASGVVDYPWTFAAE
jgi:putative acetyltransferase